MTGRGAVCGKAACTVLRGAEVQLWYGRDNVAPPGNQAENREDKAHPTTMGVSSLLTKRQCAGNNSSIRSV